MRFLVVMLWTVVIIGATVVTCYLLVVASKHVAPGGLDPIKDAHAILAGVLLAGAVGLYVLAVRGI